MTDKQIPATSDATEDDTEGNRFRGGSMPRATEPVEPEAGGRFPLVEDDETDDTQGHERR